MTKPREESGELRTIADAANFLGCSHSMIYKLQREGKLVLVKLGRGTRVTQASLDKLTADLKQHKRFTRAPAEEPKPCPSTELPEK